MLELEKTLSRIQPDLEFDPSLADLESIGNMDDIDLFIASLPNDTGDQNSSQLGPTDAEIAELNEAFPGLNLESDFNLDIMFDDEVE
jgi:hypothetical protein